MNEENFEGTTQDETPVENEEEVENTENESKEEEEVADGNE